jgi:hypothetical protein
MNITIYLNIVIKNIRLSCKYKNKYEINKLIMLLISGIIE